MDNGSSPAQVTGNNKYRVAYDSEFEFLKHMTTTRVGYNFAGWKAGNKAEREKATALDD